MTNPFEIAGRAKKVAKLLATIDVAARAAELDPIKDGERVADWIFVASREWWADIASHANVKYPSTETISAVCQAIRDRTQQWSHTQEWQIT